MLRNLHPDALAEIQKAQLRVGLICEIMYTTPVRFWTGIGDMSWDSKTWTGTGTLGGVSAIQERSGALSGTVNLSLSGIPSETLAIALADASQGCKASVWFAAFDSSWNVIGEPWLAVRGKTDVHRITLGGVTGSIDVGVITPLVSVKRVRTILYTDRDQQRRHPGDKFFEYTVSIAEKPLYWGIAGQIAAAPQYATPPEEPFSPG